MELNKEFFQKYLDMISNSFFEKDMCIVHCKSKSSDSNGDVYVLCALRLNAHSQDFDLIPVATLFSSNPYEAMEPISQNNEHIVALQKSLKITAAEQEPWKGSDYSVN